MGNSREAGLRDVRAETRSDERPEDRQDAFVDRHVGPRGDDVEAMLRVVGAPDLGALIDRIVPADIRLDRELDLEAPLSERAVLAELRELAARNGVRREYIGLGYSECVTPPVIQRGILENPGWYTAYTPYQPEIAQGRLEALLNFQTLVSDMTALDIANASLLDEGTAAAEGMTLCHRSRPRGSSAEAFLVSDRCHPQTIAVVRARAEPLGIEVRVAALGDFTFGDDVFGCLVQYPDTDGVVEDFGPLVARAHENGAQAVVAADLLSLAELRAPGEFGADVAVGSTQRFGVPLGYGGPHAAYIAARESYRRQIPGRLVGLSRDAEDRPAVRLALQTREQHIRRDKATSNICTAQVLLAVIASMYAVYHGPEGLRRIAARVRGLTATLAARLRRSGHRIPEATRFDTLRVTPRGRDGDAVVADAAARGINLRGYSGGDVGIHLGQPTEIADLVEIVAAFDGREDPDVAEDLRSGMRKVPEVPEAHARRSEFLTHEVFHKYRSETELMRYMRRLEGRDLSLNHSMIPLGSCTMKLNAAAEMLPISFPGFAAIHPFAPEDQVAGYRVLLDRFDRWLREITGFAAFSMMPNAGAQGEYAGLRVIQAYHAARGDHDRRVCLIPQSAHGTNPASAVMAGMDVVVVRSDDQGNIDLGDLAAKAREHGDRLGALMVTYPSTHGVFESGIREICATIHEHGGQVYMDGANMNAMVGVCRPGDFGADVCHLNLHKTFCIPHGGGGPGMGPIGVAAHLAPFLPGHPLTRVGGERGIGPISAAPYGSAGILPIPYAYIAMMGAGGLRRATEVAILAANYVARRLEPHYPLLYRGQDGFVAHECILDLRPFREVGIEVDDVAKRLMDYGFHAPTMSWPVAGTLMVEPTESESKEELDRFVDAMIAIRDEIREVEQGTAPREGNVLKRAPHTAAAVTADTWDRPYSREKAAYPRAWLRDGKFWPAVARVDNAYGDRNLVCACPPTEAYDPASS